MRLFLDLCVPRRLARHLDGHECVHASQVDWGDLGNGRLIATATRAGFDAMITVDANMPFQTMLAPESLAVVLVACYTNRLDHILPSVPRLLATLPTVQRGIYTVIPLLEERPEERASE